MRNAVLNRNREGRRRKVSISSIADLQTMLECSLFFSLWRLIWTKISLVDALEEQKETALIEAVP